MARPPVNESLVAFNAPRAWRLLWLAAVVFIVYASTIPFAFVTDPAVIREHWRLALQRSAVAELSGLSRPDVVQNVLLFVPIGILGTASLAQRYGLGAPLISIGFAALLSMTCELLQLLTSHRLTSAWDLWANTAGALAGTGLWLVVTPLATRAWQSLPDSDQERRRAFQVCCAVALVGVAACEPFDITLDVTSVWAKVKPLLAGGLWETHAVDDEFLTVVRFGTLTYVAAQWRRRREESLLRTRAITLAAGVLLAWGLEASQFLISARSPSIQDLTAASGGAVLGVTVVPIILRNVSTWMALTVTTILAAVPLYLQPFDLSASYGSIALVPFLAYYQFTSMQTVSHVIELMLIYAPIGFALAWTEPHGAVKRAIVVVLAMAGTLEYAQGWIMGRFPDVTDLLVAVLGGVSGSAIANLGPVRRQLS